MPILYNFYINVEKKIYKIYIATIEKASVFGGSLHVIELLSISDLLKGNIFGSNL